MPHPSTPAVPTTVAQVIDRLRAIGEELPASDGVSVFNAMYLEVTERIAAELDAGTFRDGELMVELDVRFARLWLSAYDAGSADIAVPSPWAPLFEARRTPGLLRLQYALAGMNAHIEHDLPLAVVETCRARGVDLGDPGVREDYDAINAVLASVEGEIRRSFLTAIGQRLDDEVGPLVHLVSAWNIDKARDLAWVSAETIWATRDLARLSARFVTMLGHTVGMASRYLLTPVGRGLLLDSGRALDSGTYWADGIGQGAAVPRDG
jgi:hypothetical protein